MAVVRTTTNVILRGIFNPPAPLCSSFSLSRLRGIGGTLRYAAATEREISFSRIRCASASSDGKKVSSRLAQVQQLLQEAEDRALSADINQPIPKITLEHVTVNFARSGGPGGQNVNKVNTKVDMRFNVENAYWLSDRIREKIMQMEKNRINKDGELVISSTKTRTQKGNIEDALAKLQAIIDAALYVPPPPSEEQKKKIAKMAAIGEQKRLKSKKVLSDKKAFRRSRNSWD
ncbi:hypothetical protein ACB098_10G052200 [Castanea mollissima]|uniref:Prokaryotic-type class I peptide chain release factors domain-containing protein n=1 Tax=Castanea mollissima TaxID=60419 RepID=A0A8J4RBG0_9ROSI|nr:hypothetical protein CMV_012203 [Castanea mollissima]